MLEQYGMRIAVKFKQNSLYYQSGVYRLVLRNVTEVHYNCSMVDRLRIAFESDIHHTGLTYDITDIDEFEAKIEIEIADSF